LFTEDSYQVLENYFDSNYDVVFFPLQGYDYSTNTESTRQNYYNTLLNKYKINPSKKNELLLRYKFYGPWSKLYNRDFILKNNILFDTVLASNDILMSAKSGFFMKNYIISNLSFYII